MYLIPSPQKPLEIGTLHFMIKKHVMPEFQST